MLYSESILIKTIHENDWMENATKAQFDAVIQASYDGYPTVAIASMIYAYSQGQDVTLPEICEELSLLRYTEGNEDADRLRQEKICEWLNNHDRADLLADNHAVIEIREVLFDVLDKADNLFAPPHSYEECIEVAVTKYVFESLMWNSRNELTRDEFIARYESYRGRKPLYMLTADDIILD